ncbi:MAG: prepilin-type N-terminal cleavage/methylation domain-containing protein [Candidatus Aceula meridiana]|nr:prepilin-type N-terminal cleavage/methylation domain-containing protein [Candidatus Aceula meridiana]
MIQKFSRRGFVLVEVLMTVAILSVVLTMIIRSHMASLRASTYTEEYSTAVLLLENKMTELIQKGFIRRDLEEQEAFDFPYEKFSYLFQSKKSENAEDSDNLNEVTLTLFWPSGKGERKILATTYLFNSF